MVTGLLRGEGTVGTVPTTETVSSLIDSKGTVCFQFAFGVTMVTSTEYGRLR